MSLDKIDHFVVLMLENRSFDHMLGYSAIQGTDAISGKPTAINGLTPGTTVKQVSLDGSVMLPITPDADFVMAHDPAHEFLNVRDQLWGPQGADPAGNVGFVYAYSKALGIPFDEAKRVLTVFTPDRLPVLNALAREFAVCDMWFSSIPGPTWPNRFFVHAATSGGLIASPDPTDVGGLLSDKYDRACIEGFSFRSGHLFQALEAAKRKWRVYHGDRLPQVAVLEGMVPRLIAGDGFRSFNTFCADAAASDLPDYVFIEPNYGNTQNFTGGNSQHSVGDARDGEILIKTVFEAVRSSPLWGSTALIILYDEHGGFFDHIVPGAVKATGDDSMFNGDPDTFDFKTLGFRVPAIVISPLIPKGIIDHTIYDHTSLVATVEDKFIHSHLTERDKAANTLAHLFTLDAPRADALLTAPVAATPPPVAAREMGAPPDSSGASFTHLAMAVDIALNPEQKAAIQNRVRNLKTKADASQYISEIHNKLLLKRGA